MMGISIVPIQIAMGKHTVNTQNPHVTITLITMAMETKTVQTQIVAKHKYVHNAEMEIFNETNNVMMATLQTMIDAAIIVS